MVRLMIAPAGWLSARVAVSDISSPPSVLSVESASGDDPEKQVSASVPLVDPVRQPMAQAWESVQLFCCPRVPDLQL